MNDILVKGWCPTLTRPMETGDGLLVRLHIKYGILSSETARAIAVCAEKYGNGHMDMTSRGNLQFRGVTREHYEALLFEIMNAGFTDEPRPEKVANSGYAPPLGFLPTHDDKGTLGFGVAFGRLEAGTLNWLADVAGQYGNGTVLLSAWRTVFLPMINRGDARELITEASSHGFIIDNYNPLRAIQTCPGAPACSSAQGETRELALAIAQTITKGRTVHVSGCAKGCAYSGKCSVVVTARHNGYDMAFDAVAGVTPVYASLNAQEVLNILEAL